MRFMRYQLRNTILNSHCRALLTSTTCSKQAYRCYRRAATSRWRQADIATAETQPLGHHRHEAYPPLRDIEENGSIAIEAVDHEPVPLLRYVDPETGLTKQESAFLADTREAMEESDGAVHYFTVDELLNSSKTSEKMREFLQSASRVAVFDSYAAPVYRVEALAQPLGLRSKMLRSWQARELHLPHYKFKGSVTVLLKDKMPGISQSFSRGDISGIIERLVATYVGRGEAQLLKYMKGVAERNPWIILSNSYSLMLCACHYDISRMPTLTVMDQQGEPAGADTDLRQCQLALTDRSGYQNSMKVESTLSFVQVLASMIVHWCSKVARVTPPDQAGQHKPFTFTPHDWTPYDFLVRAARTLGYGLVTWDRQEMSSIPDVTFSDEPSHLWQSGVRMSDYNFNCPTALWVTQKQCRNFATLQACISIKSHLQAAYESGKLLPEDYVKFARYWERSAATTALQTYRLRDSPPSNALIDARSIEKMLTALQELRKLDQEKVYEWEAIDENKYRVSQELLPARRYLSGAAGRLPHPAAVVRMRAISAKLPISQSHYKQLIRDSIRDNDVTIIKATTGSGKTTQVPQFILDEDTGPGRNIACTQPRQIAAISVARRVAEERGQPVGDEVGFQVRFNDQAPTATYGINYVTAGFLLRLFESDPRRICAQYSHIIFDEVHERDLDTDLLLTGMKNLMVNAPVEGLQMPKIVLMSATIDADVFVDYFKNTKSPPTVASVDVPGKTYPVSTHFLEQYWPDLLAKYSSELRSASDEADMKRFLEEQLTEQKKDPALALSPAEEDDEATDQNEEKAVLQEVHREDKFFVPHPILASMVGDLLHKSDTGDILVFLPGLSDIESLAERLRNKLDSTHKLFKLHSTFSESNIEAWEPLPEGYRRVFLSTNIAETSVTLPDVTVVVDTGYSKQGEFDQLTQSESFGSRWISKAEVAQRKGRAGRTAEGQYFATYSQKQYKAMADTQLPELLRSSLDTAILRTEVSTAFRRPADSDLAKPGGALAMAPDAPESASVDAAVEQLQRLHALTADFKITPMGALLGRMSIEPARGRLVLMALLLRCLGPSIIVAAVNPDVPLLMSVDKVADVVRARKEFAGKTLDDRLGDSAAFIAYALAELKEHREEKYRLERDSFLRVSSYKAMSRTSAQLVDQIMSMMDIPRRIGRDYDSTPILNSLFTGSMAFPNTNSNNAELIKALIFGSAGLRVAKWDGKNWRSNAEARIMPSPRSVNHLVTTRELRALNGIRRERGDMLCFLNLRKGVDSPTWASETTVMSPLGAMLFGESLRVIDDTVLVVNDWARYNIQVQGTNSHSPAEVAKTILEYRKALDRFITQAFSNICISPQRLKIVMTGEMKAGKFNTFFRNQANPLRELFANSLMEILRFEKENKAERMEARRAEAEANAPDDSKLKTYLEELKGKL